MSEGSSALQEPHIPLTPHVIDTPVKASYLDTPLYCHPRLRFLLWKFFHNPAIVLIGGTWKSGKTDLSLYLADCMLNIPFTHKHDPKKVSALVHEIASNIDTKGIFPEITDLVTLREWLYHNSYRKLFIFDEASEHLMGTRSMSGMNVGTKRLIPQISKGHARMIVVGHNLVKIDKELLSETWCRGVFLKIRETQQGKDFHYCRIISNLLNEEELLNYVPRTRIPFYPYVLAPFTEKPTSTSPCFNDKELDDFNYLVHGGKPKNLNPPMTAMQTSRFIRKIGKQLIEEKRATLSI